MSFFNTIKSFALKAKCATGFHAGDFDSIEGKPKCHMHKNCPDCGKYVTTKKHTFGPEEYESSYSCVKTKSCVHCGEVKTREQHEGYDAIDKDDFCRVKERCRRCRHERIGKTEHEWAKSTFGSTDTQIKYWCVRCDAEEMRDKKSFK